MRKLFSKPYTCLIFHFDMTRTLIYTFHAKGMDHNVFLNVVPTFFPQIMELTGRNTHIHFTNVPQ